MTQRRQFLLQSAALAGAGLAPLGAFAQQPAGFPSKPIRIVVPFGAGGVADLTARAVGQALSDRVGQSVVIENKPGAGGVGAGEAVVRSDADGHTLLLMSNATAVSATLFRKLPFDAQKDFAPVSLLAVFDLAIVVPANSRWRTFADFLAEAKANPGKINLGTIAIGSTQNLAAELFKSTAGVDVQVVPFNGTPAVITALRGGSIDAAVEILGPVRTQITAGALRPLAIMGEKREPTLADVPTVAEARGPLTGFNVASWNALAAPAATPRDRIAYLNRELNAVLTQPALKQKLAALEVDARPSTPEQLGQLLASETKRWGDVITRANIPRQ
ncbi:Bug family tripartite tricarboxylate transporter substrate binding protein [Ramlibacter sp. MAHUQ-53]|uniref:Bug family tripartite tricarboxylate transporter substrate binding protein n=1 Tax=unclassified Ramlibacter TaxID=2617605 RepID=UPI0036453689